MLKAESSVARFVQQPASHATKNVSATIHLDDQVIKERVCDICRQQS